MRAYLSVSSKEGIVEFAKKLEALQCEIVATGNTAKTLIEAGIKVINSSEITGFEELLGGRVKSLHPDIFASLLARENERKSLNYPAFDLVAVDLYHIENYIGKNIDIETLQENIDIGGVALLRAGAKNYQNVIVISDPKDYEIDIENITDETRAELALKAYQKTATYDAIVYDVLSANLKDEKLRDFEHLTLAKEGELRYGENPHQAAALYKNTGEEFIDYEVLNGKALSYNNILDTTAAINIVSDFFDVCACAIIKHTNPCGVALAPTLEEAWDKALDCDPLSAFGGIVAFSKPINEDIAKKLTAMFLEVVVAPDFSDEALKLFKTKKNLRVIKLNTPLEAIKNTQGKEYHHTPFGVLVQEKDTKELDPKDFKVVTKQKPTQEQVEDMIFAFKVARHVKSNAIVIAKDLRTLGICGGQTSRVGALEVALQRVCDSPKDAIVASDGFMPAVDNIEVAVQNRIAGIIQPGGSIKDADVIASADKYGLSMITTGIRHFKH
ncbi:bifunctional phosphoribosylaminoimidazolecarboxamide formyltransferase/IMP cyclohydrolase [bacterium]|nr:bifunctional phosphoribosylaminoimidazolecarboxamide formyltransferase/IMP cyclohydrolase [bacterium]